MIRKTYAPLEPANYIRPENFNRVTAYDLDLHPTDWRCALCRDNLRYGPAKDGARPVDINVFCTTPECDGHKIPVTVVNKLQDLPPVIQRAVAAVYLCAGLPRRNQIAKSVSETEVRPVDYAASVSAEVDAWIGTHVEYVKPGGTP